MVGRARRLQPCVPGAATLLVQVPAAMQKMEYVFKSKGLPASNNPDDIGLLQELSRRDIVHCMVHCIVHYIGLLQ